MPLFLLVLDDCCLVVKFLLNMQLNGTYGAVKFQRYLRGCKISRDRIAAAAAAALQASPAVPATHGSARVEAAAAARDRPQHVVAAALDRQAAAALDRLQ